jgi:hypothetical protein
MSGLQLHIWAGLSCTITRCTTRAMPRTVESTWDWHACHACAAAQLAKKVVGVDGEQQKPDAMRTHLASEGQGLGTQSMGVAHCEELSGDMGFRVTCVKHIQPAHPALPTAYN